MNAKLKVVMSLVTLVGVAILNGYQFSQQSGIVNSSSLMKQNLEALASGELGKGFTKTLSRLQSGIIQMYLVDWLFLKSHQCLCQEIGNQ